MLLGRRERNALGVILENARVDEARNRDARLEERGGREHGERAAVGDVGTSEVELHSNSAGRPTSAHVIG